MALVIQFTAMCERSASRSTAGRLKPRRRRMEFAPQHVRASLQRCARSIRSSDASARWSFSTVRRRRGRCAARSDGVIVDDARDDLFLTVVARCTLRRAVASARSDGARAKTCRSPSRDRGVGHRHRGPARLLCHRRRHPVRVEVRAAVRHEPRGSRKGVCSEPEAPHHQRLRGRATHRRRRVVAMEPRQPLVLSMCP